MVAAVLKNPVILLTAAVILTGGPWRAFPAAILIHELGHCLGARLTGIRLRRMSAGTGGFHLDFAMETVSYCRELAVLLSGSGLGLLSLFVCPDPAYQNCALCLNLANLLPLSSLDGGRILFCLCCLRMEGDRAERLCRRVSLGTAFLLWLAGMWIVLRVGPSPAWMLCGMAALVQTLRREE